MLLAQSEGSDEEYNPGKKTPKKSPPKRGGSAKGRKKRAASSSDPDDSDEDWKAASKKKRTPAKKGEGASTGAKGGGRGYVKPVKLSPELSDIVGSEAMPRHEVVKKMWSIIKERNLYVRAHYQSLFTYNQYI